tara:strand:+ start:3078 stop:4463 length:1386 start_codon:yes stop_codon:yes gene_type:complete
LLPEKAKNSFLLLASLFFYAWGEVYYVFLMLFSIVINYSFGLMIDHIDHQKRKKIVLLFAVAANLAILISFKYINFIVDNLNVLLLNLEIKEISLMSIPLPIGISFFTFQAMSYVIDIYRKEAKVQKNIFDLALYIALFPQLIAGPIVRFHDVAEQIKHRIVTSALFFSGIQRFIYGLAKKMLIANPLGLVADNIFALPGGELTTGLAWLGIICYSLQIYFDFSGYSDMAIGLGRMFGFKFLENFNYPYISQSIQEFWRRWHISLSSWFRDYLYIPLGGNQKGALRTYINLMIVFVLCGLWHGASWNFLIWGVFHGAFLMAERAGLGLAISHLAQPLRHIYTIVVVMIGWVFFRAEDLPSSLNFLNKMFIPTTENSIYSVASFLDIKVMATLVIAIIISLHLCSKQNKAIISRLWLKNGEGKNSWALVYSALSISYLSCLFCACVIMVVSNSYNPFIYFRF